MPVGATGGGRRLTTPDEFGLGDFMVLSRQAGNEAGKYPVDRGLRVGGRPTNIQSNDEYFGMALQHVLQQFVDSSFDGRDRD
ncbi:hypothetical protein SDC9_180191 [bioreactor metagenome]|uniref:Uncharacterized protein n=1 Tax=bioreactor metagenome TaxID=1076179 RepID=A0A645H0Y6_9ZZZZ